MDLLPGGEPGPAYQQGQQNLVWVFRWANPEKGLRALFSLAHCLCMLQGSCDKASTSRY